MTLNEDFLPKIGLGPIKLGMNKVDIERLLGQPIRVTEKGRNKFEADYDGFSVIYTPDFLLQYIEVYLGSVVRYKGKDIFTDDSIRHQLIVDDGDAQIISGVIVLLNLGISMWGLDDKEDDDKSLSIFVDGAWDQLKAKMVPYSNTNN